MWTKEISTAHYLQFLCTKEVSQLQALWPRSLTAAVMILRKVSEHTRPRSQEMQGTVFSTMGLNSRNIQLSLFGPGHAQAYGTKDCSYNSQLEPMEY
ncbi:hypothetical protein EYF80_049255 [Liparis tanakae]|uniref:Uncharacterized protein n=1 Tax=Liparis tanakae TaxID=230148 RepID=A0A4Z2FIH8_9TELE|nr:hypothetical protein EYF80_049255 [Liparis tanakae]